VLRSLAVAVVVIVVFAAIFVVWVIRSPLPQVDGQVALPGLRHPVTIRRDQRGIPHIQSTTESDLFFAEGFACAQDRLWQMDLLRRQAEGKLSEIAGAATLENDRYMRTLGFAAASEHDFKRLNAVERGDLQAYADGVNAAASSHRLPLEFFLMHYRPQPWTPIDSIAVAKLMAQRLDDNWSKSMVRADMQTKVGKTVTAALFDNQVARLEKYVATAGWPGYHKGNTGSEATEVGISGGFARWEPPAEREAGTGSNNWSVSGARTSTGKPVLANDTHLAHSLPSTWWIAHLKGAGYDVEGFTVPGIPGIVIGHNERIAFGITSAVEAVQDIFVEHFRSATSDEYRANGRWLTAAHRRETILVKGGSPATLDVLITRHGPVVKRHGLFGDALAWTILRDGGEPNAIRKLDLARNWSDFRNALRGITGPALSFVYADVDGNVGYQDCGRVPRRVRGDGSLPVEGEDDRYAWSGSLAFEELPTSLNPRGGIAATANNALVPANSKLKLSPFFDPPYRVHRIFEQLSKRYAATPQQIGAVQSDVYDYPRAVLARATVAALAHSGDSRMIGVRKNLASWDGTFAAASTVPTFVAAEDRLLSAKLLRPALGADLYRRYEKDNFPIAALERVLDGDRRLAGIGISRASLIAAIAQAVSSAADEVGVDGNGSFDGVQPWGEHNAAIYDHPLGHASPLTTLLNIKPAPQSGDIFTIYAGRPAFGPSQRVTMDVSNWDDASMLLTLGESGHFTSSHYGDQADDFRNVHWVPTPFSDSVVVRETADVLTVTPLH